MCDLLLNILPNPIENAWHLESLRHQNFDVAAFALCIFEILTAAFVHVMLTIECSINRLLQFIGPEIAVIQFVVVVDIFDEKCSARTR